MPKEATGSRPRKAITADYPTTPIVSLYIDAGTRHIRIQGCAADGTVEYDRTFPANTDLTEILSSAGKLAKGTSLAASSAPVITGKLAGAVRERLGRGAS